MTDANHRAEVERLARTLKSSKVVQTEGEALRMAEDMLSTSKKVHEDFKKRDSEIYGRDAPNAEHEKAKLIMEKLSENLAKGKPNVRIDMGELDLGKPLKELVPQEESREVEDDDDAVLLSSIGVDVNAPAPQPIEEVAKSTPEPVVLTPAGAETIKIDEDFDDDDDQPDGTEEERAEEIAVAYEPEEQTSETPKESEEEFSVKDL